MSLYLPLKHKIVTRQPYLVNFIIIITWLTAFSITLFFILLGGFLKKTLAPSSYINFEILLKSRMKIGTVSLMELFGQDNREQNYLLSELIFYSKVLYQ